jgi:LysM repeat protein
MQSVEAEQRYRELEEKRTQGELTEEAFLLEVSQLRVVGEDGRRWMINGRTGQWFVHDGQRWMPAEPPTAGPEAGGMAEDAPPSALEAERSAARTSTHPARPAQSGAPRWLASCAVAFLVVGCVIAAVVAGWVLFLRDLGEGPPAPASGTAVAQVQTYTPRPATATYTPTLTRTPSRTPTEVVPFAPTAATTPTQTAPTPRGTLIPITAPVLSSPTATFEPSATPTATSSPRPLQTYVVKKGDTLFEIAMRFGVSLQALAAANGITDPKLIRPGQTLVIPEPGATPPTPARTAAPTVTPSPRSQQTYVVKKGDTLSGIALRFGVSVQALAAANGITDPRLIRPGQVLVIPQPGATPTATATP